MKALFFAGGTALLSILACSAPSAAADPLVLADVRWIAEPVGRNTAAAIALAAFMADPEEVLLITPSDHLIGTPDIYDATIASARQLAEAGYLVTIGLRPAYPETGYGYIHHDGNDVIRFVEKPDAANAVRMLESGDYLWNSGIFCSKASVMLDELKQYAPEIYEASKLAAEEQVRSGKISLATMEAIPSNSIDYAVMEKCAADGGSLPVRMVPLGGRLVGPRRMGRRVAGGRAQRTGQRSARRRAARGRPQHARARHQPAGERGRPGQRGHRRNA